MAILPAIQGVILCLPGGVLVLLGKLTGRPTVLSSGSLLQETLIIRTVTVTHGPNSMGPFSMDLAGTASPFIFLLHTSILQRLPVLKNPPFPSFSVPWNS